MRLRGLPITSETALKGSERKQDLEAATVVQAIKISTLLKVYVSYWSRVLQIDHSTQIQNAAAFVQLQTKPVRQGE